MNWMTFIFLSNQIQIYLNIKTWFEKYSIKVEYSIILVDKQLILYNSDMVEWVITRNQEKNTKTIEITNLSPHKLSVLNITIATRQQQFSSLVSSTPNQTIQIITIIPITYTRYSSSIWCFSSIILWICLCLFAFFRSTLNSFHDL